MAGIDAFAYDFAVNNIYYNKLSDDKCAVTFGDKYYVGTVNIPTSVIYKGASLTVTSIGEFAFRGCKNLTELTIGSSVESIALNAFAGCTGIESLSVDLGNTVFDSRDNCNAIISTATNALQRACNTTKIPSTVTCIEWAAFSYCHGLKSIDIPNSVTKIRANAFQDCINLTSVNLPNSLIYIGSEAFSGCSSLSDITLPNSVISIGGHAFNGCTSIDKPIFNENAFVFMPKTYKGDYTIPANVAVISQYAFAGCMELTGVTIPSSVENIGSFAFNGCTSLTQINLPNSIQSIELSTFSGCKALQSIVIPNSVETINAYAFSGCSSLSTATIGYSVAEIGANAFSKCPQLTKVYACMLEPNTPTQTPFDIDESGKIPATLYAPAQYIGNYTANTYWSKFADVQEWNGAETIAATAITLNETEKTIQTEYGTQLTATLSPEYCSPIVVWSTSNPSVATVSNKGYVIAVGIGKATITATTPSGLTATCQINVTSNDGKTDQKSISKKLSAIESLMSKTINRIK